MGQFTFKTDFPGEAADEIWERMVFSILGHQIPHCEGITGMKMSDRLPTSWKWTPVPITAVRFEIWYRDMNKHDCAKMRNSINEMLATPLSCGGKAKLGKYRFSADNTDTMRCR